MTGLQGSLQWVQLRWTTILEQLREIRNKLFDGNCFPLLEIFLMISGLCLSPEMKPWKQRVCRTVNVISVLQIALTIGTWNGTSDVLQIAWYVLKMLGIGTCSIKVVLLMRFAVPIRKVQSYIENKFTDGNVEQYDELVRKKNGRSVQRLIVAIVAIVTINVVVICVPNAERNKLLEIPTFFLTFGSLFYGTLQCVYIFFVPLIWIPMYLSYPLVMGIVLTGLRTELQILQHRTEYLVDQTSLELFRDDYWKTMKGVVRDLVKQQQELLRHFQIVRQLVGFGFFISYHFAIFFIGTMLFFAKMQNVAFFVIFMLSTFMIVIFECYCWCYLVDSLGDVVGAIAYNIYELCVKLPYSQEHHSEFVDMRISLMIVWINTCRSAQVNCFGIFSICFEKFVSLCNTSYTVFTFFISMR